MRWVRSFEECRCNDLQWATSYKSILDQISMNVIELTKHSVINVTYDVVVNLVAICKMPPMKSLIWTIGPVYYIVMKRRANAEASRLCRYSGLYELAMAQLSVARPPVYIEIFHFNIVAIYLHIQLISVTTLLISGNFDVIESNVVPRNPKNVVKTTSPCFGN